MIGDALGRAWSLGAGPGEQPAGGRHRLDDPRGVRKAQRWRRLRLHQGARLPPDPRHEGRHRRDPPCPAAQGIGQHPARHQALRRRARGPPAPGRGHRQDHHPLRLGVLVQRHHQGARAPGGLLHHGRAHRHKGRRRRISKIDESDWVAIEYPAGGEAMVAECIYKGRRLVVRRTRLTGPQATCGPTGGTSPS